MTQDVNIDLGRLWERFRTRLHEKGVEFDIPEDFNFFDDLPHVKVVCVTPDLKQSVEEMGQTQRDHVVMVRVDSETLEALDAWVATGAVKSRSEAAALFIREGLTVRADELAQLRDALREVQEAQERLKTRAQEIFGKDKEG